MAAFLAGIFSAIASIALGLYVAAVAGLIPANADAVPSKPERWFAQTALKATVGREARAQSDPLPASDVNIIAGIRLYKQNCAICHGGADAVASRIARGLYQRPPLLAKRGVEDDPAEVIYWKIAHGIRLTGMPAFSKTLNQTQLWQITLFLQKMDHLAPSAQKAWITQSSD